MQESASSAPKITAVRRTGGSALVPVRFVPIRFVPVRSVSIPGTHKGGDDAVQRAQFLLGRVRALKEIAQVAHHARPLVGVADKPACLELFLEMVEEALQLGLVRRPAAADMQCLGFGAV